MLTRRKQNTIGELAHATENPTAYAIWIARSTGMRIGLAAAILGIAGVILTFIVVKTAGPIGYVFAGYVMLTVCALMVLQGRNESLADIASTAAKNTPRERTHANREEHAEG